MFYNSFSLFRIVIKYYISEFYETNVFKLLRYWVR